MNFQSNSNMNSFASTKTKKNKKFKILSIGVTEKIVPILLAIKPTALGNIFKNTRVLLCL